MRDIARHGLDHFWDPEDHEPLTPQEFALAKRRIRRNWWGRGEKDPLKHGSTIIALLAATFMLERTVDQMEAVATGLQDQLRDLGYLSGQGMEADAEPGPTYLAEAALGISEPSKPRLDGDDALFWLLLDLWSDNDDRVLEDRMDSLHHVLAWDEGNFWDLNYY